MQQSNVLPVIIKGQYQGGDAFAQLVQDAKRSGDQAKRAFAKEFAEIGRTARQSLARGLTPGGSVDVGVDEFRKAAAEATAYRQTLETIGRTATQLAVKTGDTSTATRNYLQALSAQTNEARQAERAAQNQLATHGRLQTALDQNKGSVDRLATSYRELERARNADNIAAAAAEVRNRRFTEFQQGTGIGPDVTSSARASAAVFEEQARAAAAYASNLELVKRAIDPTRIAQQQLDAELARADQAFERGAISAAEYGVAVNRAADQYQHMVTGARQGTTAHQNVLNSTRATRTAFIQLGQQMQDVTIQAQMGTNAFMIFSQQVPQAMFALSGLERSANRTQARIGAFATFMSGPWGAAIFAATAVLGPFIYKLIKTDDAATGSAKSLKKTVEQMKDQQRQARESEKASGLFDQSLMGVKKAADEARKAIEQLENRQKTQTERTVESIQKSLDNAKALRAQTEALITAAEAWNARYRSSLASTDPRFASQFKVDDAVLAQLKEDLKEAKREASELEAELTKAISFRTVEQASRSPEQVIRDRYDALITRAREAAVASGKVGDALDREVKALNAARDAELKLLADSKRAGSSTGDRDARVGDMVALIQQLFPGARITSTTGGKHKKGSDHYAGRAIDFVPAGGMGAYTTEEVEQILESAGVSIRRNATGTKQLFGPGRSAGKKGDHDDHFHVAWKGQPNPESAADAAARAAKRDADQMARFAEFAADAADKTARIRQNFTETPPVIARMNDGLIALDDLSRSVDEQMRRGLDPRLAEALKQQIADLRPVIEDSVNQPFRDMVKAADENAAIQDLLIAGLEVEAEVLSRVLDLQEQTGDVTDEQIQAVYQIVLQEQALSRELEKQNELRLREVELIEATRDNIRDTMQDLARGGGAGSIGRLFKRQFDLMLTNAVDDLFEGLFGDFFRDQKDKALGFDLVKDASKDQVASIRTAITALNDFTTATNNAAAALANPAANDNDWANIPEIVVNGKRFDLEGEFDKEFGAGTRSIPPREFLGTLTEKIASAVGGKEFGKSVGDAVSDGLSGNGAAYGALASGFAFGGGSSPFLSAAGGALGEKFLAKPLEKGLESIAKGLGDFAGPLAGILGGLAGGLLGSAFSSTPRASSTIGVGSDGALQVVSTRGNSASRRKASEGAAGEALDTLERIADALGASIDAARGSVSIGVRKGNYRVDTTGQGITKTSKGAIDFGEDSAAAIRAATLDLIQDGVLQGLRDSTQRLLQQAKDLDSGIQKAVDFESVFDRLKAYKDPVGAAIDGVDKEFRRLIRIFEEAGASAQEWADLEELYGLERAEAIKAATEAATSTLRDFITGLETGDNGLSLRARLANAKEIYEPLAEAVRAGQTVDFSEFTDAADTMLRISRELFGSQTEYFDTFNEILGLSKQALAGQENVISIAEGQETPFSNRTTVDTVPVVTAVTDLSQLLLSQSTATNEWLEKLYNAVIANNNSGPPMPTGATYF